MNFLLGLVFVAAFLFRVVLGFGGFVFWCLFLTFRVWNLMLYFRI